MNLSVCKLSVKSSHCITVPFIVINVRFEKFATVKLLQIFFFQFHGHKRGIIVPLRICYSVNVRFLEPKPGIALRSSEKQNRTVIKLFCPFYHCPDQRPSDAPPLIFGQHAQQPKVQYGKHPVFLFYDRITANNMPNDRTVFQFRNQTERHDPIPAPQFMDHPMLIEAADLPTLDPVVIPEGGSRYFFYSTIIFFFFRSDVYIYAIPSIHVCLSDMK